MYFLSKSPSEKIVFMKICNTNRDSFYFILDACFRQLKVRPKLIELGVLRGENAELMNSILKPELFLLIDAWSSAAFNEFIRLNQDRDWVEFVNTFDDYFGGSIADQSTFERLHHVTEQRFEKNSNVKIIRATTSEALIDIERLHPEKKFDLIYVDANHQYENVLDDLINYQPKLSEIGLFQLNDCCFSEAGVKQNLGVIEAVCRFAKQKNFIPVALTNNDFSDILLAHQHNPMLNMMDSIFQMSNIPYVDIPHQLLGAAKVLDGSGKISFV